MSESFEVRLTGADRAVLANQACRPRRIPVPEGLRCCSRNLAGWYAHGLFLVSVVVLLCVPVALTAQAESGQGGQRASVATVSQGLRPGNHPPPLPRVMSTNLCADMLLLGLADDSQITSLSHQARNPLRSSLAATAARFPANRATAEEVIMQQPDIVLASRRWQSQHQSDLFERFGITVVNVPFPKDWPGIFDSLRQLGELIGRTEQADAIIRQTQDRLQGIEAPLSVSSVLYLRGNGGTAAAGTYIDALLHGMNVSNQATAYGLNGWSHVSLESILLAPPDAFLISQTRHDVSPGRSGVTRHPLLRRVLDSRPVVALSKLDNGCSNWRQIDTVERLAAVLGEQSSESAGRVAP